MSNPKLNFRWEEAADGHLSLLINDTEISYVYQADGGWVAGSYGPWEDQFGFLTVEEAKQVCENIFADWYYGIKSEKSFSESQVNELLSQQRDLCESKAQDVLGVHGGDVLTAIQNAILTL